jgi:hypothetical protein
LTVPVAPIVGERAQGRELPGVERPLITTNAAASLHNLATP